MEQNVGVMVEKVILLLKEQGYTRRALTNNRTFLCKVTEWFNHCNDGKYDQHLLEVLRAKFEDELRNQKISKSRYNGFMRALRRLQELHKTGAITIDYNTGRKKYVPGADSADIIQAIMSGVTFSAAYTKTMNGYMRRFFCYLEDRGLSANEVSRVVIQEYISLVFPHSKGQMDKIMYALKLIAAYLYENGLIGEKINFDFLSPKRRHKRLIPPFTQAEISQTLSAIDLDSPVGKRNYAIILLACSTGLRGCDISNIKLSDIKWNPGEISIVQQKTKRVLRLPLSGQVRNAVSDYILSNRPKSHHTNVFLRSRAPFEPLSRSALHNIINRACAKAGVEKKAGRSFHSLRRSFGSWLAAESVDIELLSQMMGLADMDSGKPYISFKDKEMSVCALDFADIPLESGVYV